MWKHQQEAVEWALDRQHAILHMGMGTGKSRCLLEILMRCGAKRALICCPKAVVPAWGKQAGLWLGGYRVLLLTKGTSAQKEKLLVGALADSSPLIVVVNYETAWRLPTIGG